MPLVDPFGRDITYLRVSVTDRCNLRCAYCMPDHPDHADHEDVLTFEEIDRLVRVAVSLGWTKVRLTGGEPLVRKDLVELVRMLGRHKEPAGGGPRLEGLVMTTNAILLARHAEALAAAGLDRVNVSLDSLQVGRFREITGYDKLPEVLEGIEAAVQAGLRPVKINVVLIKGSTEDEWLDFVALARDRELDLRFIEFMPFAENGWSLEQVLPTAELRARIEEQHPLTPLEAPRSGGPARTFTSPGWKGRVSFISPISDRDFCSACNRVRMTSEGRLRGCLLNENELDFREAVRGGADDTELAAMFRQAVRLKPEEHPYHQDIRERNAVGPVDGRGMHRIGG